MVDLSFLQSHALLGGVQEQELQKIQALFKQHHFKKGNCIVREEDSGDCLYLIYHGAVEILKKTPTPEGSVDERLAILQSGESFGEMQLIDIEPRSATVRAVADTEAFSLANKDLFSIAEWSPETFTLIIMNIAREISRRLRRMDSLAATLLYASRAGEPSRDV